MSTYLALKRSNCRNCCKCLSNCAVKSIRFSGDQAYIIGNECIFCGKCFDVCPQNAKEVVSEQEKVEVFIRSGQPVYMSIDPSFAANYEGVGIEFMRDAVKKLGFTDCEETALGATMVAREYDRMLREENRDIVISSTCHAINLLVQKYYPRQLRYLADVLSPMQAHCKEIKRRIPDAKTVFVGPCIAKKNEAEHYDGIVDAVLTFDELSQWLASREIGLEMGLDKTDESRARFTATSGGMIKSMECDAKGFEYISIDGVEKCIDALRDIDKGNVHNCFIEMSACEGGCIGGPVMERARRARVRNYMAISSYTGTVPFDVVQPSPADMRKNFEGITIRAKKPTEEEISEIMNRIGVYDPGREFDCGSCGYNTCRDKAIAIFQGKSDLETCLPYLKDKAESFSDTIMKNTPNGVVVLNENLEIQQINTAARKLMNIRAAFDVLGEQVVNILDPGMFMEVLKTGQGIYDKRMYLAEYRRHVEQTIVHDRESHLLICLMRDVTDEENERTRAETLSAQTVEVADRVVDKQMRIVQEIASLLGETAAETKIALTKLKESISNE